MKAKDMRDMTRVELSEKLTELKSELFNLRFQHATNQLENPIRIAEVKRDIARTKTILREMELRVNA
jgi:large subunit ribosomal protein L29